VIYGCCSCNWLSGFYRLADLASSQKKADQGPFGKLHSCLHRGRFYLYLLSEHGLARGGKDISLYYFGWCVDIHSCVVSAACQGGSTLALLRFPSVS